MELGGTFALGRWQVHRLGYGAMQLAGDNVFGPPRDRDEALRVHFRDCLSFWGICRHQQRERQEWAPSWGSG